MTRPPETVLWIIAPNHEIDGLPVRDSGVRNVAHAELRDTLRLPRNGDYESTLVAVKKFYDGSGGGEAGHYALIFVEFRHGGTRWRTPGVKVRAVEAGRFVRALKTRKASAPGRSEPRRVGGKDAPNTESSLEGAPVGKDGYLLYVRSKHPRNGEWSRSGGVEISAAEAPMVAATLKALIATAAEKT
jgi:hypothetical protein